ncbi:MAG TPA: molybdopterin biosynthesis protein [Methanoregula sp.]|nr:molybdopterin biosynthesis protein [Methanoregula sp.]
MVKRYLDIKPLAEVQGIVSRSFGCVPSVERVPLEKCAGRVTASPVIARYSVPEIHLAAMDGIAVKSGDTTGADVQHPVTLNRAVRVNTGNIVPAEYDAVIMIEDVWIENEQYVIRKAVPPWQHIRPAGEDIGESEMVLASRHVIRPHETGALAAYGIENVDVLSVRIGIIPTGSELVDHHTRPAPGQIVESNTLMASAILTAAGAQCTRYPIVKDEPDLISDAIKKALKENEIVVVSAGSSAGTRDYTADVIAELGEVLVHGIAIKPGKPAIIGCVGKKPVIGMPGYPLSALTLLREIVLPMLGRYGLNPPVTDTLPGQLTTMLHKDIGTEEFVLCAAGKVGSRWVLSPLSRGASVQMSAVRANAYIRIPPGVEGLEKGKPVTATLMVPRAEAEQALLITGSHDPVLDYLGDLLKYRNIDLHSTNVGSMGGIISLVNDECHAAPMHLLADDGSYNIPYIEKHMPGQEIVLVCVAERQQGIISRDGLGFDDLVHHTYVNRQKGAGTRLLLDFELRKRGIDPRNIKGYDREVTTHLAVALAVKSGEADAGMGVFSAAKALNLRFMPVGTERYELAIRASHMADPKVKALVETIESQKFKAVLERLGGYDTKETGVQRTLPQSR